MANREHMLAKTTTLQPTLNQLPLKRAVTQRAHGWNGNDVGITPYCSRITESIANQLDGQTEVNFDLCLTVSLTNAWVFGMRLVGHCNNNDDPNI